MISYVSCSVYGKAAAGEILNLPGIDAPFEAPADPEIQLDTDPLSANEVLSKTVAGLNERLGWGL